MTFKERLKDFSQDTSMHGVKYVGKENSHWIKRQVVTFMIKFKILIKRAHFQEYFKNQVLSSV